MGRFVVILDIGVFLNTIHKDPRNKYYRSSTFVDLSVVDHLFVYLTSDSYVNI